MYIADNFALSVKPACYYETDAKAYKDVFSWKRHLDHEYSLRKGGVTIAVCANEKKFWHEVAKYPEILDHLEQTRGLVPAGLRHRAAMFLEGRDVDAMTEKLSKDIGDIYVFLASAIGATVHAKRVEAIQMRRARNFSPWRVRTKVTNTYLPGAEKDFLQMLAIPDPLTENAFGLRMATLQKFADYAIFREKIAFAFEKLTNETGIQLVDPYQGSMLDL